MYTVNTGRGDSGGGGHYNPMYFKEKITKVEGISCEMIFPNFGFLNSNMVFTLKSSDGRI